MMKMPANQDAEHNAILWIINIKRLTSRKMTLAATYVYAIAGKNGRRRNRRLV